MSNTHRLLGSTITPAVTTSFVTPHGTATTPLNILILNPGDTSANSTNGIDIFGGVAGTGTQNEADIKLTNRIRGIATTVDGVTIVPIYSFPLGAVAGTYLFEVRVVGYNLTDNTSAGYTSYRVVRTNGAAATQVSATPGIISEEGTMVGVDVVNGVAGNSATLTAKGLPGKTIHWLALTTYIMVT